MKTLDPKSHATLMLFSFLAFFCLSTIYFIFFAQYIFYYQEGSVLFQTSFSYLTSHLNQPGNFMVWLAELQTTFYYFPFVGALIISAEMSLVVLITSKIGKLVNERTFLLLPFSIGSILFLLQTNYQYFGINNLGILLQLLMFYFVIRFLKGNKLWIPVILFPIWYFLTGSFSAIFLISILIYLFVGFEYKNWIKALVMLALNVLFFLVGREFLFYQTT